MLIRLAMLQAPRREPSATWAHRAISGHWDELRAIVGSDDRMPPDDDPAAPRSRRLFRVHGCGRYGCVFPTRDPDVVLKVTTDPEEAGLAEAWMRHGSDQSKPGIVRYYAATELPIRRGGRPVYVLWREAADDVGSAISRHGWFSGLLDLFMIGARAVRSSAARATSSREYTEEATRRAEAMLRSDSITYAEVADVSDLQQRLKVAPDGARVGTKDRGAVAVAACRMTASAMARAGRESELIGAELLRWMDRGVLLCDVRQANIGLAPRGGGPRLVITDPSWALLLDGTHDGLRVPPLDEAARLGWREAGRRQNPPRRADEGDLFDLFLAERERFARRYPAVSEASFELSDAPCNRSGTTCAKRDVAYASWAQAAGSSRKTHQRVVILRRALSLPRDNLVAIVRHELGHLADPLASKPGAEARADRIAAEVGGQPINYDRNDLQTVGAGSPTRPRHLHQ